MRGAKNRYLIADHWGSLPPKSFNASRDQIGQTSGGSEPKPFHCAGHLVLLYGFQHISFRVMKDEERRLIGLRSIHSAAGAADDASIVCYLQEGISINNNSHLIPLK